MLFQLLLCLFAGEYLLSHEFEYILRRRLWRPGLFGLHGGGLTL
jgi:hypothetical protein